MRATLRHATASPAATLFLLNLGCNGEPAGRLARPLEATRLRYDIQRQVQDAASPRLRDHEDVAQRMRDGKFGTAGQRLP